MGVVVKLLNMNFFLLISLAAATMAGPMSQGIQAEPYIHEEVPYVHVEIPAEPYVHEEPSMNPAALADSAPQPTGYAGVPHVGVPEPVVPWTGKCFNVRGEAVECRNF